MAKNATWTRQQSAIAPLTGDRTQSGDQTSQEEQQEQEDPTAEPQQATEPVKE